MFTQTDPLPLGVGTAFESPYVYAYDNPLKFVDPTGKRAGGPTGSPIASARPNLDSRPPAERRSLIEQRVEQLKRNATIFGGCLAGSAALVAAGQGAYCQASDTSGGYGEFLSVGGGAGFELGAGGGAFFSNAQVVDNLSGWAACEGVGVGAISGEFCQFQSSGNSYISFFGGGFLTGQAKVGGHITAVRTYRVPPTLQRFRDGVADQVNATKDGVTAVVRDIPNGGRNTRNNVNRLKCFLTRDC